MAFSTFLQNLVLISTKFATYRTLVKFRGTKVEKVMLEEDDISKNYRFIYLPRRLKNQ
jgi:hypothetical protein